MRITLIILIFSGLYFSCQHNSSSSERVRRKTDLGKDYSQPIQISEKLKKAAGAYFTKNQNGNPVLVWTEAVSENEQDGNIIKFTTLKNDGNEIGAIQEIPTSKGCRQHDESMSKIAFKKDGTIVAVYSKRTPSKKNRFAGALFYTQSFDGGKAWTDSKYLHVGDTTLGLSRSFFDLATLPDGEVGAIWLDSRLTEKRGDGSSLFFAKTSGRDGFLTDQVIAKGTCECCRTDLFVAEDGKIHAIFRDILSGGMRDMAHLFSSDLGNTFSSSSRISKDDWLINGCPHTGPSMGETPTGLHFTWFTQGGGAGIYYTFSPKEKDVYFPRKLVTPKGQHPQLLALKNDKVVFVWEERVGQNIAHVSGHHHENKSSIAEKPEIEKEIDQTSFIKAQIWQEGYPSQEVWVSLPKQIGEYPVVTELNENKIGIAWVQTNQDGEYGIFYKMIEI